MTAQLVSVGAMNYFTVANLCFSGDKPAMKNAWQSSRHSSEPTSRPRHQLSAKIVPMLNDILNNRIQGVIKGCHSHRTVLEINFEIKSSYSNNLLHNMATSLHFPWYPAMI